MSAICTCLHHLLIWSPLLTNNEDYLPVYFQAVLGASPLRSSVQTLPTALVIAPFALFCGIIVKVINKYRAVNVVGWIISIIGFGLLSLLRADSTLR